MEAFKYLSSTIKFYNILYHVSHTLNITEEIIDNFFFFCNVIALPLGIS